MYVALSVDHAELPFGMHKNYIREKLTSIHIVIVCVFHLMILVKKMCRSLENIDPHPLVPGWVRRVYSVWKGEKKVCFFRNQLIRSFEKKLDVNEFKIHRNVN